MLRKKFGRLLKTVFNNLNNRTVFINCRYNFIFAVLQPGCHVDIITNKTGNMTLKDGCIPFKYTLIHNICTICLRDDWKIKIEEKNKQIFSFMMMTIFNTVLKKKTINLVQAK